MAYTPITQIISVLDEVVEYSANYFEDISNRNNALVTTVFPEINTLTTQMNQAGEDIQYYATLADNSKNSASVSAYNAGVYRDEALSAKNGAELSYRNTVTLIEDLDITGTGGYTVDAIDSMNDDSDLEEFIDFKLN